jgi:hypothetical protein
LFLLLDRQERHAQLIAACPTEAALCGIPETIPDMDVQTPDFAAIRDGFECLKSIDVAIVQPACAELLSSMQARGAGKGRDHGMGEGENSSIVSFFCSRSMRCR